MYGHPNVHVTFVCKNFNVTHFTSKQNHFTNITSVHSTSLHFTSLMTRANILLSFKHRFLRSLARKN